MEISPKRGEFANGVVRKRTPILEIALDDLAPLAGQQGQSQIE